MQNNFNEAKVKAELYIKMWPNDPYLWRMLGLVGYKMNDRNLAQSAFNKSQTIELSPITQYYISQLEQNLPIEIREL